MKFSLEDIMMATINIFITTLMVCLSIAVIYATYSFVFGLLW